MIATQDFLVKRFETFNHAYFDGALPPVPIKLGRAVRSLGSCTYKKRRKLFGKQEYYDFCLHISTRYDLPEDELEDILLHEMIHYEILVNQRQDTSAHGRLFRARMKQFNEQYGRHISVSHRHALPPVAAPKDLKPQLVALVHMKDGRIGVKRLPANLRRSASQRSESQPTDRQQRGAGQTSKRQSESQKRSAGHMSQRQSMSQPGDWQEMDSRQNDTLQADRQALGSRQNDTQQIVLQRSDLLRMNAYRRGLLRSGEVASVDFYINNDPYFLRFPKSSALNIFFPADPDLLTHFSTARLLQL